MHEVWEALGHFWAGLMAGQLEPPGGWSYVVLALLVAIEGPLATLLGAAAASAGLLRPSLVFVAAATGNLAADTTWYLLGYLGKVGGLLRYGRWLGLRQEQVTWLEAKMQAHAHKVLLVTKLTLSFSIPALVAAGLAHVPWRKWFVTVALAECLWTGTLVWAGYHFSRSLKGLEFGLQVIAFLGFVVVAAGLFRFLMRRTTRSELPLEK
jgi:membrane protein DedA with SNARE-associated domain